MSAWFNLYCNTWHNLWKRGLEIVCQIWAKYSKTFLCLIPSSAYILRWVETEKNYTDSCLLNYFISISFKWSAPRPGHIIYVKGLQSRAYNGEGGPGEGGGCCPVRNMWLSSSTVTYFRGFFFWNNAYKPIQKSSSHLHQTLLCNH